VRARPFELASRLPGDDDVAVLEAIAKQRGTPQSIRVDNGPEFVSKSLDCWTYFQGVELDFSRPGKPTDNAFIESFNGKLRQECLIQPWFLSLEDAQDRINQWRDHYNRDRPHIALGDRTPLEFTVFSGQACLA
jgi:putative transposase